MHAKRLLADLQLIRLHRMTRECRFNLAKFLREDGAPRGLTRAICDMHSKIRCDPVPVRREMEFGLRTELGDNTEWCLVLATVLGHRETVADCLLKNWSLWQTYKEAACFAANSAYKDVCDDVEVLLDNV